MQGRAPGRTLGAAIASMLRPNVDAAAVARRVAASACTDVSGFGLAGHLRTLLRDGRVRATIWPSALPAIEGAVTLLGRGVRSTFHAQNRHPDVRIAPALAGDPAVELVFDPQTSGGLLFSVGPARATEAVRLLRDAGDHAACVIGELRERHEGDALIEVVTNGEAPSEAGG